jgi:hypothetical protein
MSLSTLSGACAPSVAGVPVVHRPVPNRRKIALCAATAYEYMPVTECAKLLMLKSEREAKDFIAVEQARCAFTSRVRRPDEPRRTQLPWQAVDGKFVFPRGPKTDLEVPSRRMVTQALGYASELERIV